MFCLGYGQNGDKNMSNDTNSSAVAKRPRDASCLSVVSFNSTKRRVESFIVKLHGKTRMACLADGEKNLMICLFVLT